MSQHAPRRTTSARPARRRLAVGLAAALVLLSTWVLGAPTATAAPSRSPGTLEVGAYDYLTGADADVTVGSADTNLVVTFTARRALTDGTLAVALPTRDWPDPLQVGDRLGPNDPTLRGAVVVRPSVDYDELTDADCRASEGQAVGVTVANRAAARTATVAHLACAAGQSITLRIFGVQAPTRVGPALLLATVGDASGATSAVLRVTVRPFPTTRLDVQPSSPVSSLTGQLVTFTVTAIDTRGRRDRVDTGYRGTVDVIPVGVDCFVTSVEKLPITFTKEDRGTKTIHLSFGAPQVFRMTAYDVANRARPGYSAAITVTPGPDYEVSTCSRSYH